MISDVQGSSFGESPERPGPSASIREVLALVFKQHGIGGDPKLRRVVAAWREAVGSESFARTRVVSFLRNVLSVEVDSAALLQELAVYRKRELLQALRRVEASISEVKFRVGGKRGP